MGDVEQAVKYFTNRIEEGIHEEEANIARLEAKLEPKLPLKIYTEYALEIEYSKGTIHGLNLVLSALAGAN